LRLVYFGSAGFAIPALERLAAHVVLVVSQPDQPTGRGLEMRATPVKTRALELGLTVETPEKSRAPEFVERIEGLDADALVVAAYGQILSERLLNSARQGGINLHGSILPRWRGAAPIQRAIEAGDPISGVTLMQMARGMDTGDIIAIEETPIGADETAGELFDRLAEIAGEMAVEWMPLIAAGEYPRQKQEDAEATLAPKVTKEDARLTFEMTAEEAYRRFRAFTPAPGAFLETTKGPVKILRARLGEGYLGTGYVGDVKPDLTVGFADGGAMRLLEVQPAGRKRMTGTEFANGARLAVGECLMVTKDE
jgi:methionyl-tRNA formyltransferase